MPESPEIHTDTLREKFSEEVERERGGFLRKNRTWYGIVCRTGREYIA